jgi:hypothetical protein
MPNERLFNRAIKITLSVALGVTLMLIVLNALVQFSVRGIDVVVNSAQQVEIQNQRIRIKFNRPLPKQDFAQFIEITPKLDVTYANLAEELVIVPQQALASNTKYQIKIKPGLLNVYNETLKTEFVHEFTTRSLNLYYLQKHADGTDKIGRYSLATNQSQDIYQADDILTYEVRHNELITIEQQTFERRLAKLTRLENNFTQEITPANLSVYAVQFSPVLNEAYFLAKDLDAKDEFGQSIGGRFAHVFDLEKRSWKQLEISADIGDIDELVIADDGKTLLVKDTASGVYYLVDLTDTTNTVPLGKFIGNGGFNYQGREIMFNAINILDEDTNPYVVVVNSEKQERALSSKLLFTIDAYFANLSNAYVWAERYQEIENTRGLFNIQVFNAKGELQKVINRPGFSLELPQFSPDDRYLSIEAFTLDQVVNPTDIRVLGFQSKSFAGSGLIYDLQQQKFLDVELPGVELRWR